MRKHVVEQLKRGERMGGRGWMHRSIVARGQVARGAGG
jgi:hypothetical protein